MSIKVIPSGSLAILLSSNSLAPEVCLIISVLPKSSWNDFGFPGYRILKKNGMIETCTSAIIREFHESR